SPTTRSTASSSSSRTRRNETPCRRLQFLDLDTGASAGAGAPVCGGQPEGGARRGRQGIHRGEGRGRVRRFGAAARAHREGRTRRGLRIGQYGTSAIARKRGPRRAGQALRAQPFV